MEVVLAAAVTGLAAIAVAYLEKERRTASKRWQETDAAHNAIGEKIDLIGATLGKSIDRVEETSLRTEEKLDQHINDHVTGKLKV